jgi:hypothetical protein
MHYSVQHPHKYQVVTRVDAVCCDSKWRWERLNLAPAAHGLIYNKVTLFILKQSSM